MFQQAWKELPKATMFGLGMIIGASKLHEGLLTLHLTLSPIHEIQYLFSSLSPTQSTAILDPYLKQSLHYHCT